MRKQLYSVVSVALAGLVGLAAGCGGGDDDDDDDIVITPDATPGPDRPPGAGDGNDDFDDAQDVTVDGAPTSGRIQEPLDHDFFKFDGTAGTWMHVAISANPEDNLDEVDTVIRLYNASRTQIAENDDAVPRINTDSEVIIRLPDTGTYYIEVLEFTEWFGEPAEGENTALFDYDVIVSTVNPAGLGVLEDPENGDDAASASDAKFDMGGGLIVGDFNDNTDVDVFRLAIGTTGGQAISLSSAIVPDGTDGYGSTASPGNVWLTNDAGTQILARIDASTGLFQLSPPIAENTSYLVWIEHSGGASGSNDFYVYKFFVSAANPPETEPNDMPGNATPLTDSGGGSHFIRANIAGSGGTDDVDYFSVQVIGSDKKISVACAGQSVGSGVRGLTAQVLDQEETVLDSQQEPVTGAGIFLQEIPASLPGIYYLRLTKSSQDAEVTGNFARCGFHVQ